MAAKRPAPAAEVSAELRRFGLSVRESEVLLWVYRGKTNDEIGRILGCRPRTVEKHLERVYLKLKVENRTAAAWAVHVVLGER